MRRRTGEETRALLLDTGLQMLIERGVSAGVGHVRLQEVVKRAGLTTGAAYRLWPNQDDFHRDLAVQTARWRDVGPIDGTVAALADLDPGTIDLDDVVRVGCAAHIAGLEGEGSDRNERMFLLALALRAASRTWEDLQTASLERHHESVTEFGQLYQGLMDRFGFRMRSPFRLEDFTTAVAALGEGFGLQAIEGVPHTVIDLDTDGQSEEWTLFGLCVQALVQRFMEPDA